MRTALQIFTIGQLGSGNKDSLSCLKVSLEKWRVEMRFLSQQSSALRYYTMYITTHDHNATVPQINISPSKQSTSADVSLASVQRWTDVRLTSGDVDCLLGHQVHLPFRAAFFPCIT